MCVLQKPRLPPGEGCSSESKNSLYKNDTPKDVDVQTGRAPFLPVETPEELKFITEIER